MSGRTYLAKAALAVLMLSGSVWSAFAAPGDVLFSDNFDDGGACSTLAPWTTTNASFSGTSTFTANSGICSLHTNGVAVTVTAPVTDLSGITGADLTIWIRRGADAFSEDTDPGEDLVIEYLDTGSVWQQISNYPGAGTNGEVILLSEALPLDALHSGFRLRVRQTAGSGTNWDYWHVDDVVITESGTPPPPPLPTGMGVNRCEEFESGFGNWTTTNATRSAINGDTFSSPGNSMYLRHNTVTTTSIAFDSNNLAEIEVWVRRGSDAFSENPETGEDLIFQYLNASSTWVTLETFTGSGAQGEIFDRTYSVPISAWHANFQVRFTLPTGSGSDFDYWHIDDLCFVQAVPDFAIQKSVVIEQDPVNGTTNPMGIPGAWAIYSITVTNNGLGEVDDGTMKIGDQIDALTTLFTGNFDGAGSPFEFVDGTGADISGLTLVFGGTGDGSDGVIFRNGAGSSITPSGGFDASVASFELQFSGVMNGTGSGGNPTFTIRYRVLVE